MTKTTIASDIDCDCRTNPDREECLANPTTIETITDKQIKALQTEAARACDLEQMRLCRVALGLPVLTRPTHTETTAARLACVEAIRDTERS